MKHKLKLVFYKLTIQLHCFILYSDSSSQRCGWFCAYRWVWRRSGLWRLLRFRLCSLRALKLRLFCSGGVQLSLPSFLQHQAPSLFLGDFNRGVFAEGLIYWRLACVKRWWAGANACGSWCANRARCQMCKIIHAVHLARLSQRTCHIWHFYQSEWRSTCKSVNLARALIHKASN